MKLITIDFETYYDRDFSLTKLTTEEYIRDPQFETIGVGVKVNDGEAVWFSDTRGEIRGFLEQYDWSDAIAVAHNAMFDAAILSWIFDIRPHMWCDTLSLARAIDGVEVGGSLKACAERHGLGVKGTEVVNALALRRQDFGSEQLARYGEYCKNDCDLTWRLLNVYI
jgi:DNA polymerase